MKTLLTSAALAAMMTTSAMANFTSPTVAGTAVWNGQAPSNGQTCSFKSNTPGKMVYVAGVNPNTPNGKPFRWSTSPTVSGEPAVVELTLIKQAGGQNAVYPKNIKVEPAIWSDTAGGWVNGGDKIDIHTGDSVSASTTKPGEIHKASINYTSVAGSDILLDTGNGFQSIDGSGATKVNTNAFNVDDLGNITATLKFVIHGDATHVDSSGNDLTSSSTPPPLTSDEYYQASHLITCLQ